MASTVPWQPNETPRQVIAHLTAGQCVVLPTESTYEIVASAVHARAVQQLQNVVGPHTPAVALTDAAEVLDWLPLLAGGGARLVRKLGAGPYVLNADASYRNGLFKHLPDFSRHALSCDNGLQVRLADHPIWSELRPTGAPLISIPISGATDATEAARLAGDHVALIVDGGAPQFALTPSVVQADRRSIKLLREGGLTAEQLGELTLCRILFICTGNTCRSPMAETLCVKLLADKLGCAPSDLAQHGFAVQSAGLAAAMGSEASVEGVQAAAALGADASRHRSRMASVEMLLWADHVFAMTSGHWSALRSVDVPNLPVPEMLSPSQEDIADPIGRALVDYQWCASQIVECLHQRLPQLLES